MKIVNDAAMQALGAYAVDACYSSDSVQASVPRSWPRGC